MKASSVIVYLLINTLWLPWIPITSRYFTPINPHLLTSTHPTPSLLFPCPLYWVQREKLFRLRQNHITLIIIHKGKQGRCQYLQSMKLPSNDGLLSRVFKTQNLNSYFQVTYSQSMKLPVNQRPSILIVEVRMLHILYCGFILMVCYQEAESLKIHNHSQFYPWLIVVVRSHAEQSHHLLPPLSSPLPPLSSTLFHELDVNQNELALQCPVRQIKRKRRGKAIAVMNSNLCPRGSRYSEYREKCVPRFFG